MDSRASRLNIGSSSERAISFPDPSSTRITGSIAEPQRRASTSKTRRSPALTCKRYTSRSGPLSVPFSVSEVDGIVCAFSMLSF